MMKAMFQTQKESGAVQCLLCPNQCVIKENNMSPCLSRVNNEGVLYAGNYGQIASIALDPIEKKPLTEFHPGKKILSIGSYGCNLHCSYCQNWEISQVKAPTREMSVQDLVQYALETVPQGNIGIGYTYNEPTVWYEFVLDCAKSVHAAGLLNVLVTNGYIAKEPLEKLLPFVDAMNIDLKGFSTDFYQNLCKGRLAPVLETISTCASHCHVELTTLVIPGWNDNPEQMADMAKWIANISPEIPLHMTRYRPSYKMTEPNMPEKKAMDVLASIASNHLNRVYVNGQIIRQ